jgi:alanine racemase
MSISRRDFLGAATVGLGAATLPDLSTLAGNPVVDGRPQGGVARHLSGARETRERFDPWVEVIPHHLLQNVEEVRRLSGGRPILAVVKNNGYGLGLENLGPILDGLPAISGFAVVKGEEALALRAAGVRKPVLLMGMFSPAEGLELARSGVQLSLYTRDALERIAPLSEGLGGPLDVQLYLDTGMGRMGMPHRDAAGWMANVAGDPRVRVRGTFTALTEDRDFDPIQLERFLDVADSARNRGVATGPLHAAASNGVFHFSDAHLDAVRPGIAIFGAYPSVPDVEEAMAPLRCGVRFCCRVVRVEQLQEGDSVSYGRAWVADAPTWVATLPVGHADGYPREAVGGAQVLVNGRLYPVIGAVSASHAIIRLGDTPAVSVGDTAILMGPDHPAIEPNHLADSLGVSVYDVLMHLNPDLPRSVVDRQA